MRVGSNPAKFSKKDKAISDKFHQIIIPVYIPEEKGYYKEGLKILKICIASIIATVHDKTFISVINNGSCQEVRKYLDHCFNTNKIDEVIHTIAIGKINAISKGLAGHHFELVTITDADVLFKPNWQKAVYEIYSTFPKAGMVGTTPNSKMIKYLTENVHFDNFFKKNFKFRKVFNPDEMLEFAKSIGNEKMFDKSDYNNILTIKKNNTIAVTGSGHFTGTYKKKLLENLKLYYSNYKLNSISDKEALDIPSVKFGHWRLCTYENYTFHLGNKTEDWMYEMLEKILNSKKVDSTKPHLKDKSGNLLVKKRQQFFRKIFFNKVIQKYYFKYLGFKKDKTIKY